MDPELAFIQANLVKASNSKLILDPFCGTGGILLGAAHFGAYVLGMEICYEVARAVGKSARQGETRLRHDQSILANFEQYGLVDRFLGTIIADSSLHNLWRFSNGNKTKNGGEKEDLAIFDAIITDPPYGIRERGQRLGRKINMDSVKKQPLNMNPEDDDKYSTKAEENELQHQPFFPSKKRYSITRVFLDLMNLSVTLLRLGGRLAFWFPVSNSEYSEDILPEHPCMRRLFNCEQPLTRDFSRRLLIYEKFRSSNKNCAEDAFFHTNCYETKTFRDRWFAASARIQQQQKK